MTRISQINLRTRVLVAGALVAGSLLAACGGDDDDDANGGSAAELGECATSFNDEAPDEFPRLIRISHDPENQILAGTFAGAEFTAEVFDEKTGGDGVEVTVPEGACVVAEENITVGALYIFAVGDDGAWHRFSETDPAVPLAGKRITAQLDGVEAVALAAAEEPEVPELVPADAGTVTEPESSPSGY